MKKLFLLLISGALALGANAQNANSVVFTSYKHKTPIEKDAPVYFKTNTANTNQKTTAGGSRWYDYLPFIEAAAGSLNGAIMPIWHNNQVLQRFSTGLDTINYTSAAQYFDPVGFGASGFTGWKDASVYPDATIHVSAGNAYTVDSISIAGGYVEVANRPAGIVDTLILSVAQSSGIWTLNKTDYSWISNYTTQNQLLSTGPYKADSINKALISNVGNPLTDRKYWKVPLFDADRDPEDAQGNITTKQWNFEVPGGLNVPAGGAFSVSVTFKSGDTWTPGVDSFSHFHHFMPLSSYIAANAYMKYYYYDMNDRNASTMMFSFDTGRYIPSIIIEGLNTNSYRYEYHQIAAKITCPTCATVSVDDIEGNIISANAYPNPATAEVRIPFALKAAADVNVTMTNTVGQVVKSATISNTTKDEATFSVSDLSNGVYFYTVLANGERQTGRVVVNH